MSGINVWAWVPRLGILAVLVVYLYVLFYVLALSAAIGGVVPQLIGIALFTGGLALAWTVYRRTPFIRRFW